MAVKNNKTSAKPTNAEQTENQKEEVVFTWANYKWMFLGVLIIVVGFVLMAGGGSDNPAEFNYDAIFSWRRIGLAPMVVLAGFGVVGYSIMKRFKK